MKMTSSPESYRYCTFFVSVWTRGNFSPARNVRSTTAPEPRLLSLVRTNAPPLPGFTCWKSTMRHTPPSIPMCIPFLNWFVLTVSATRQRLTQQPRLGAMSKGWEAVAPQFLEFVRGGRHAGHADAAGRPLGGYLSALAAAGLHVELLRELPSRRRSPGRIPIFLDLLARK